MKKTRKQVLLTDAREMLKSGTYLIATDRGDFFLGLDDCRFDGMAYLFENCFVRLAISMFDKGGETVYATVKIECKTDLVLYHVSFRIATPKAMQELVFYKSFIDAPAAGFLRCGEFGFYIGVENPFFHVTGENGDVVVTYQPSLMLKKGEQYESDALFFGVYQPWGELVSEQATMNLESMKSGVKRTRFFNPSGEIPLDRAEIHAMRRYVTEYYDVMGKQFDNILYYFFYPHKGLPTTKEKERIFYDQIDRFTALQGDIVVFNPHVKTTLPTEEQPYWELLPEGSSAQRIFEYATKKGLRCGYYMGCAFHGEGGNAALLPFMPQKTEWKKRDCFENIADENCLACDEYLDWWYTVQENTIEKYQLGYWAWDPGPGNGNDCFAQNHGHIPGKGEYKGWRNSLRLLERLKKRFPNLFLQSFYGRKEYGLWGFRYFSQHEVYWEQTLLYGATLHNDFSDYRINAHGTRLQNLWSMNYRFLPAHIGHGLVTRMGESYYDPELDRAIDFIGWKYSLLSAIAYCGSITHCNLPDKIEHIEGMEAFYQKWIRWAREHYEYCNYAVPISDAVGNGLVDGIARIKGDRGQLFLFNSSPQMIWKDIVLDERLGFDTDRAFYFHLLYCERVDLGDESVSYRGAFKMGDHLSIELPPYGAVVLEMKGEAAKQRIDKISCCTHILSQYWDERGAPFVPFDHPAYDSLVLFATARFGHAVKDALARSIVPNKHFVAGKLEEWKQAGIPFNFTTSFPDRLLTYISISGLKMPSSIDLRINGEAVRVERFCLEDQPVLHYAYIEDYVIWDHENTFELRFSDLSRDSFMGLYFEYPDVQDGIEALQNVLPEKDLVSGAYADDTLVIDSFAVTPQVLYQYDCEFEVIVKTKVPYERIETVYFLHPTQPQMPSLQYDPIKDVWYGRYRTGDRRFQIFSNSKIYAVIKAKDGGIGPKKYQSFSVVYGELPNQVPEKG